MERRRQSERPAPSPDRLRELRSMPYAEYLRTPEWKARRAEQIRKVGGTCQICGKPPLNQPGGHLVIHHRTYRNRGNERFVDLLVIHQMHHELIHQSMSIEGTGKLLRPQAEEPVVPGAPPPVTLSDRDLERLAEVVRRQDRVEAVSDQSDRQRRRRAVAIGVGVTVLLAASIGGGIALSSNSGGTADAANLDCRELAYEAAQRVLAADPSDPHHLDGDGDGEACDSKRLFGSAP